jgi:hypothetical protein
MEIEGRRFLELAIHVKLASEAVLEVARNLAALRPIDTATEAGAWHRAVDELVAMNVELGLMERILRRATRRPVALPRPGRNGGSVPMTGEK